MRKALRRTYTTSYTTTLYARKLLLQLGVHTLHVFGSLVRLSFQYIYELKLLLRSLR
jgi:hypothetical protein